MGAARSPEQLKLHCPTCGDELVPSRSGDPLALCLACRAKHRFFIMPKPPSAAATSNAASMRLPHLAGRSPDAVSAFWLSDKAARSVLNEQLAELLRVAVENRRVPYESAFVQCPLCGERLAEYEQPDVWVQGLRCPNSHSWASRGSRLYGMAQGSRLTLHGELSDTTIAQLIQGWLKGNRALDSQLHDSVRRVLESSPLLRERAS